MVSSSFTFILKISGVGGKLTKAVYLAPNLVFWNILHFFNIIFTGNIMFKNFKHNFIRATVASSKLILIYRFSRSGGQAVQSGLSCPPPDILEIVCITQIFQHCDQEYETK